ncbi:MULTISPECIES: LysR substrate-binding domain-containing protein [Cobetia]|uniref:LysR substrate-binding domain-containing protein n=1 Tax=Cobetia TaxID=204286 RepID=UPI00098437A7|nr:MULTISPECIES: LysR substrate-binding domain-containing protein [Cobetia]POR06088.1 LysR family transcriptional regulator [Cobetia sp. MM1IDA2H-1]
MPARDALPPLQCLRAFEAAARHGSFTQAGRELNLTQSAISRQIKRLEDDLGRPLFERDPEGLRPTPAGEDYYRVIRRVLRDLADETTRQRRRGNERQLTLATSPTVASTWLARRLTDFRDAHPDIELRILTVEDPYRLDLAEFDLGIYYHLSNEIDPPGLSAEAIFHEEDVIAVCSPAYLERYGPIHDAEDMLANHTLLVVEDFFKDWLTWQHWYQSLGLDWQSPAHSLRANSYQLLIHAAFAGQGVILCWSRLLGEDIAAGRLVKALPHALTSIGTFSLLTPQHRHMSQAAQRFSRWLLGQRPPQEAGHEDDESAAARPPAPPSDRA